MYLAYKSLKDQKLILKRKGQKVLINPDYLLIDILCGVRKKIKTCNEHKKQYIRLNVGIMHIMV